MSGLVARALGLQAWLRVAHVPQNKMEPGATYAEWDR